MEVSFGEILLIVAIAFLVLGPQELVLRSQQMGKWMARMRTELNNFKVMAQEQLLKDPLIPPQQEMASHSSQETEKGTLDG